MGALITNNGLSTLSGSLTAIATTLGVAAGTGALFPNPGTGEYFYATLVDSSNNIEVIKVTGRSTDTFTIVRGQDGTSWHAYSSGDRIELRPTAALFTESGAGSADNARLCDGRLTLTSGTPVTTGDVTAAETLYFTPYKGNGISLYNGTYWHRYTFAELSIDVPDATNCYDVFAYDTAGAVALELLAWTNATTRATAITLQNGIYVKSGTTTRRYLGTFYSTTAGNGQVEDSVAKRNLWNYYNRVQRPLSVKEATNSWAYSTNTYRQMNNSAANQLEFVRGVEEDAVSATVLASRAEDAAGYGVVAIGLDSTTTRSTDCLTAPEAVSATSELATHIATYKGFPGVGRHLLVALERAQASGNSTWYGDNGGGDPDTQAGILGELLG